MGATDKQKALALRLARYHRKGLDHGGVISMIHEESSVTPAHPSTEECFVCYGGLVFISHHELTEEGEEVEVIEAVSCRRCAADTR